VKKVPVEVKRPTLETVAQLCGVSTSTVSRALSRPDIVKPAVRERVLAAATEIGYRPNKMARGLATGRLGRLGLLVPDIANPFFAEILRVVHHVASATAQSSVLIVDSDERAGDEADLIAGLSEEVDGVIVASPRAPTGALTRAVAGTPVVFINRPITGHDAVLLEYEDAIVAAGEHLVRDGHRSIALVRGPSASWAASQRANALTRWAKERGVRLIDMGAGAPTFATGLDSVHRVIDSGATAVVAYDDMVASGVIAGLHAVGRSVPGDVAVVGCDDTLLARLLTPAMTTVSPPYARIGVAALNLLNARIENPAAPARRVKLPCTLVLRESSQRSAAFPRS
jgi:DNA-binding LacI/PurR family transcriptional regulator